MEIDLKHVMYLVIGLVLVAALGTYVAKPIYTKISTQSSAINTIDFTNAGAQTGGH